MPENSIFHPKIPCWRPLNILLADLGWAHAEALWVLKSFWCSLGMAGKGKDSSCGSDLTLAASRTMLGPAGAPGSVPRSLSASAPSTTFSTLVFHSTASLRGCVARPSPVPAEGTAQRCPWPHKGEPRTPATPHPCRFGFVPSFRCSQSSSFSFRKGLLALLLLQSPATGSTNHFSK